MIRHPWRPVPLFRVLLPFIAGIGCAFSFCNDFFRGTIAAFLLFLIPALLVGVFQQRRFRYYTLQGGILQVLLCIQGFVMVLLVRENLYPHHYTRKSNDWCEVKLTEDPSVRGKKLRATVELLRTGNDSSWHIATGRLLCYFTHDSSASGLRCNDRIIMPFHVSNIAANKIPGEFNYRLFMERRQVYARSSVKNFVNVSAGTGYSIRVFAFTCRRFLLSTLQQYLGSGQEYAVAAALLIGEDDFVDKPLMQAFTYTGTLHILSVSGMHVGLIYMLLATVLGRFENRKGWRIGYFILLYGFLWSYALITGLSAPVVRSAMMLSLVLSGKLLERKSPVLNTLAGSFFLLMMINPFWITETGFQLSYLAVFGIMALHPMLLKQMEFSNIWLHRIWELISVSLCAQIITFPVSLYYFGQFPNYFLISNLLIIPVSTLAIYGGILVMITCRIPYAGEYISMAECYLIKFLNGLTLFLGELPGAVSQTGKITILNCLLLYVIFYLMVKWLQERSADSIQKFLLSLIAWTLIVLSGL